MAAKPIPNMNCECCFIIIENRYLNSFLPIELQRQPIGLGLPLLFVHNPLASLNYSYLMWRRRSPLLLPQNYLMHLGKPNFATMLHSIFFVAKTNRGSNPMPIEVSFSRELRRWNRNLVQWFGRTHVITSDTFV